MRRKFSAFKELVCADSNFARAEWNDISPLASLRKRDYRESSTVVKKLAAANENPPRNLINAVKTQPERRGGKMSFPRRWKIN